MLLSAAGVLAAGGGLGGLGAIGQLTSGPALPDTGLEVASADSLEDAEIVGVDLSEPAAPGATAGVGGSPAELAAGSGGAGALPAAPGSPPASPGPPGTTPGAPPAEPTGSTSPGESPGAGQPRNPLDDVVDPLRGVGNQLPGPLGPTTNDILDLLTRGEP